MYRLFICVAVLLLPVIASAHVTVKPGEVGIGAYQTFNVSVPTEKDIATVGVRLIIPEGLESVRPNVKPGWEIELVKEGEGEGAMIKEIVWKGGSIPKDQRDDFFFSAKTPAVEGALVWKAYQTYSDGSVVSWDKTSDEQPKDEQGEADFSSFGPFSETRIINDLKKNEAASLSVQRTDEKKEFNGGMDKRHRRDVNHVMLISLVMSAAALILALIPYLPKRKYTEVTKIQE